MARVKEETGNRYGRLVVTHRAHTDKKQGVMWGCTCDCGKMIVVRGKSLRIKNTESCGCLKIDRVTKHGLHNDVLYYVLHNIYARCLNKKSKYYKNYGARGIKICDRWKQGAPDAIENFFADMGPRPSPAHSIDRIDNDGPYSPANCRWAVDSEQSRNKRNNKFITHAGRTQVVIDWAEELGLQPRKIYWRLVHGWTHAQALGFEKRK